MDVWLHTHTNFISKSNIELVVIKKCYVPLWGLSGEKKIQP